MRYKKDCQKIMIKLVRPKQNSVKKSSEEILEKIKTRLWGSLSAKITSFPQWLSISICNSESFLETKAYSQYIKKIQVELLWLEQMWRIQSPLCSTSPPFPTSLGRKPRLETMSFFYLLTPFTHCSYHLLPTSGHYQSILHIFQFGFLFLFCFAFFFF